MSIKVSHNQPTASGIPYSFMVVWVIRPSVPSEPTNKLVRLYPATVFLKTHASMRIVNENSIPGILMLCLVIM